MIVMKFGGSSVESAAAIARVTGIVRAQLERRPVVVVSAMAKTTRKLVAAAEAAAAGDLEKAWALFDELQEYHRRESHAAVPPAAHAELDALLDHDFAALRRELEKTASEGPVTLRQADRIASFGELVSSRILAFALGGAWIDCRQVLITNDDFTRAQPVYEETEPRMRQALLPLLQEGEIPVLGGYVGATCEGVTTTLGYEGSDFSAAIVGAALGAEEVQIWTDVDGMMTADPRVVKTARRIRSLSFNEALELACSGAKKPHPGTLGPASRRDVPIRILNSGHFSSLGEGTLIGRRNGAAPGIKSITCRPAVHQLRVLPPSPEDCQKVWEICERFRPALLVLSADEERIELSLDRSDRLEEIRRALEPFAEIEVRPGKAVVTLVSEDLASHPGLAEKTLEIAGRWEPRLLLEGVSAPCIRCLVDEPEAVVAELHERVFSGPPREPVA